LLASQVAVLPSPSRKSHRPFAYNVQSHDESDQPPAINEAIEKETDKMRSLRFSMNVLAVALLMCGLSSVASAQASRTWVSGVGDDANPCSRTAPCKTFAGAISKTAAAGEIDCLDPGGFGALTITKSITIDCDSGVGSVLVSGTNGIAINAGASDVVYIRNLTINGLGSGIDGIVVFSALTVHVQEVDIFDFSVACISVEASGSAQLTVENSSLTNCGSAGIKTGAGGTVVGDIHNVRIWNAGNGINAQNGSRLTVSNSVIAFANPGINQSGLSGAGSVVLVTGCTLSLNGTAALQSSGGGIITASGNTFSGNAVIFNLNGGQIFTGGDNKRLATDAVGATSGPAPTI
jgi:hypothetical protein